MDRVPQLGRLHVLTDETLQDRFTHVELARLAAEGGADHVQFREKRRSATRRLVETATHLREVLRSTRASLIVNDRVDVAAAVDARGVHLGRDDLDPALARRILGSTVWIGATANDPDQARRLSSAPIDYLGVGPVFGTTSKRRPAPMLGLEALREIVRSVGVPVIAIGGITVDRIRPVLDTGAHGVAVLSSIVCDPDPRAATRRFREAVEQAVRAVAG